MNPRLKAVASQMDSFTLRGAENEDLALSRKGIPFGMVRTYRFVPPRSPD